MAPFPLVSFQDTIAHADAIRDAILSERMPPTSLDARFGRFSNVEELTPKEAKVILDWIDSGRNVGQLNANPRAAKPITWHIDQPSAVITSKDGIKIPAGKGRRSFYHLVPESVSSIVFAQETFANQLEVLPTNASAVRHLQAYLFAPGVDPTAENRGQAFATVTRTPSGREFYFPEGTALPIPAKSRVLFEMIVASTSKPLVEKPTLGIVFSAGNVDREIRMEALRADDLSIEPNDPASIRIEDRRLASNVELWGILPAMNSLGKEFRLSRQTSTEDPETLLQIDRYDPAYRVAYWLYEPITLNHGDRLIVEARWDNSRLASRSASQAGAIKVGPLPTGESLDVWLITRVPTSVPRADRFLTNASALALSATTRVLPEDPFQVPASMAGRTQLEPVAGTNESWLASSTKPKEKEPWTSQVASKTFDVKADHLYVARVRVKCDQKRRLSAILDDPTKPFQPCSDHQLFDVGPEPTETRIKFVAKKSHPAAAVHFYIGENDSKVEFSSLIVEDYGNPKEIPFRIRNSGKQGITLRPSEGVNGRFQVAVPTDVGPTPWGDSIVGVPFEAKKGDSYTITFRAKGDRLRKINVSLAQEHPPHQYVGVGRQVTLVRQWERYSISGSVDRDDKIQLVIFVGGDETDFELADVEVVKK
jgi:hypothetical protein